MSEDNDLRSFRDDVRELRQDMGKMQTEIRSELRQLSDSLGHVRVEVAKTQGDTKSVNARTIMIWAVVVMLLNSILPLLFERMLKTP